MKDVLKICAAISLIILLAQCTQPHIEWLYVVAPFIVVVLAIGFYGALVAALATVQLIFDILVNLSK